jgi:hypothetical protein
MSIGIGDYMIDSGKIRIKLKNICTRNKKGLNVSEDREKE